MFSNVGSKPPRDFTAGGKYSVAWKLFHYLTPQEWHTGAAEKSEYCTNVSTTGNISLGGGRVNAGKFKFFLLLFICSFVLRDLRDKSWVKMVMTSVYFILFRQTLAHGSHTISFLSFFLYYDDLVFIRNFLQLIPSHDISGTLLSAAFLWALISNL